MYQLLNYPKWFFIRHRCITTARKGPIWEPLVGKIICVKHTGWGTPCSSVCLIVWTFRGAWLNLPLHLMREMFSRCDVMARIQRWFDYSGEQWSLLKSLRIVMTWSFRCSEGHGWMSKWKTMERLKRPPSSSAANRILSQTIDWIDRTTQTVRCFGYAVGPTLLDPTRFW